MMPSLNGMKLETGKNLWGTLKKNQNFSFGQVVQQSIVMWQYIIGTKNIKWWCQEKLPIGERFEIWNIDIIFIKCKFAWKSLCLKSTPEIDQLPAWFSWIPF